MALNQGLPGFRYVVLTMAHLSFPECSPRLEGNLDDLLYSAEALPGSSCAAFSGKVHPQVAGSEGGSQGATRNS